MAERAAGLDRAWVLGVFLTTLAVYVLATTQILAYLEPPSGDQPHYLMTVISLVEDHDFDVRNNYTSSASDDELYPLPPYSSDFKGTTLPYPLDPGDYFSARTRRPNEWYSKHGLGWPLLLVPGWILGQALDPLLEGLTASGNGGWPGTVLELNLLGALLGTQVFLLAWDTTRDRTIALAVWAALAFSNPQFSYSLVIFSELAAGLLVVYAFRRLRLGWTANRWWQLGLVGLCVGYLPWIQPRFLLMAAALAALAAYQWWRARAALHVGRLALVLGPAALGVTLLAAYHLWLYGALLPGAANYGVFFVPPPADPDHWARSGGLALLLAAFGMLFDQQFGLLSHSPVFVLAPVGLVALWRDRTGRATVVWLALIILPYLLLVTDFEFWWGRWSPPARYWTTVTPLLGAPLAASLLGLRRSAAYRGIFAALAGLGLAIMAGLLAGLWDHPVDSLPAFFNRESGQSSLLLWLDQRLHLNLIPLIPAITPWFAKPESPLAWPLILICLGLSVALVVGTVTMLMATRPEPEGAMATRPEPLLLAPLGGLGLILLALVGQSVWSAPPSPKAPKAADMIVEFVRTRSGFAAVLKNVFDQTATLVLDITYYQDGVPVTRSTATANDVPPGGQRAALTRPSSRVSGLETISAGLSAIATSDGQNGRRADIATRIQFGQPSVSSRFGLQVAATNQDAAAHSFTVEGMLYRAGGFVGVTTGAVDDLNVGATATVTLLADGRLPKYDRVIVAVDKLLK